MNYLNALVEAILAAPTRTTRVVCIPDDRGNARHDLFILEQDIGGGDWVRLHSVCRYEDARLASYPI